MSISLVRGSARANRKNVRARRQSSDQFWESKMSDIKPTGYAKTDSCPTLNSPRLNFRGLGFAPVSRERRWLLLHIPTNRCKTAKNSSAPASPAVDVRGHGRQQEHSQRSVAAAEFGSCMPH
jgi:hypothetical protein